ncbi:MAG: RNA polymerase sigma factor [Bacteroidota bacterium]
MIDLKRNIEVPEFDGFRGEKSDLQKGGSNQETLIWESFKNGNQKALAYIFRNYSIDLFNYGYQFTTDRNLVKDCLQDVFLELIKHRKNLKTTDSIRFYLMRCMRNKVISTLQKNTRREQVEKDKDKDERSFEISVSSELKMINGQLDNEKRALIEKKINELPDLQREAILLYFYEGLKYAEIAELLNIKVKSSRALIYRALESMKELLAPFRGSILLFTTSFSFLI